MTRSAIDVFQGEVMPVRKAFVLLVSLSTIAFMAACGGSSGTAPVNPTPPASGGNFGNNNLNGTYVFSISGTDANEAPYAMAGTLTANGSGSGCSTKGSVTAGTLDIASTDTEEFTAPVARATFTGSYCIEVDGRGQATVTTNIGAGFPNLTFDFVMQDTSHGLVIEFDSFGTASGTLDLQSSGVTPSGPTRSSFLGRPTVAARPSPAPGISRWVRGGRSAPEQPISTTTPRPFIRMKLSPGT